MAWLTRIVASTTLLGLATGGVTLALGRRFIKEFTRPGVTVERGTPQWDGWTFPESVVEPPAELQRAVVFQSADGTLLHGEFWAQPQSAPTIVISHAFHFPSVYFRSVAALEYAHGANILLFDYRGHGKSALIPTTCGNAEVNDLLAAVDVAAGQPETAHGLVFIHGFSMGAAVALLLPPHASVAGIIADSSYARLDEMTRMIIAQVLDQQISGWRGPARVLRVLLPSLTHLTHLGGQLLFRVRHRYPLVARPDRAIGDHPAKQAKSIPGTQSPAILLIHAADDPFIALHHAHRLEAAARAVGRSIEVYFTPSAIHCGSYGHDPQRYSALVRDFVALKAVV
jgi:uncharacterized protein